MTARPHTKIAKTIAPALVIAAVVAPGALAGSSKGAHVTIPASLANFHEPGSTGYFPNTTRVTIPAALAKLREPGSTGYVAQTTRVAIPASLSRLHEPGSTGYVPTTASVQARGGFDWVSALIGAGGALGMAIATAGSVMALRKRRQVVHV